MSDLLTGVQAIAAGQSHTCAVMQTGNARCWGINNYGQLGDGAILGYLVSTPPTSDALTGVKATAAGEGHTCALTETGGVRCWGGNAYGQLGDGTTTSTSTPPTSDVLTGVQAIAVGRYYTCALMDTGGVR